jgi:hypothetical protein
MKLMDPHLQWQIDYLEEKLKEIEPRSGIHPEARELCTEALEWRLRDLRAFGQAGDTEQATLTLLSIWHTYHVVMSRILDAEKVRRRIDEALDRASSAYLPASETTVVATS